MELAGLAPGPGREGAPGAIQAIMVAVPGTTIEVRARPGARRDEIVGVRDGVLLARVTAPALEGRANQALCRLIAKRLGVRRSHVTLVRGERSRDKLLRVEGIDRLELKATLGLPD